MKRSDYQIDYQYQFWKIKKKSVCASYQGNLLDYSKCTSEAKKMFHEMCAYLQSHPEKFRQGRQLKAMYCSFASTYQPVVASINASNEPESELSGARNTCNSLIMKTMKTKSAFDISRRDTACNKYNELKKK